MNYISFVMLFMFMYTSGSSQIVYNNGANIYSGPAAIIKVEGSVANSNSGVIEHNGLIIIDSSYINHQTAKTKGNGRYDVFLHWINSGEFARDTSTVNLNGMIQHIKGDSVSRFYNLNLLGSGEKRLFINSEVHRTLDLTINELSTQQDTMFLKNANPAALQGSFVFGSEGFISNRDSGCFVRKTMTNNSYYFPMGNKVGIQRFRPVVITPTDALQNEYSLSFYNQDASMSGFNILSKDSSICRINDKFYHKVGRIKGSSVANIEIGYLPTPDTYFNSIGNWKGSAVEWRDILSVNQTSIGSYTSNKRLNWSNFNDLPYVLASVKPTLLSVLGQTLVCGSSAMNYSVPNNPNYSYDWGIRGGSFNNNDSVSSSVYVTWIKGGTGNISLIVTDLSSGCSSAQFTTNVNVSSGPQAGFNLFTAPFMPGMPITITDNSNNASLWFYNLGNGKTTISQNGNTIFSAPGTYTITQIVTDGFGCIDSLMKVITVENMIDIPNVFTPNGDGANDIFSFNCNGCDSYELEIHDRWGVKIYEGSKGSEFWDGMTASGEPVKDGTYFYILKVTYQETKKNLTGFIQLIH